MIIFLFNAGVFRKSGHKSRWREVCAFKYQEGKMAELYAGF
jgi:hypothetical protein